MRRRGGGQGGEGRKATSEEGNDIHTLKKKKKE